MHVHPERSTAGPRGTFSQVSTQMTQMDILKACVSVCDNVYICTAPTQNSSICERTQGFYKAKVNVKREICHTRPSL